MSFLLRRSGARMADDMSLSEIPRLIFLGVKYFLTPFEAKSWRGASGISDQASGFGGLIDVTSLFGFGLRASALPDGAMRNHKRRRLLF